MDINSIVVSGRLTRDPETKGNVVKFSIANNRGFKGKEKVSFFNCVAFGKTGEIAGQYLKKGSSIGIMGEVEIKKWEDKYYTSIIVKEFVFLNSNQGDRENAATAVKDKFMGHEVNDAPPIDDLPF